MTKKEIARKVWYRFSDAVLIYITVKFFLGMANIYDMVFLVIFYSLLGVCLILKIALKIVDMIYCYKTYKSLVSGFKYLQNVHKARYKLYFTGDSEKLEEYSEEIERQGNAILKSGKDIISYGLCNKWNMKKVEEIICQTEKLMTSVR